MCLKFLTFEKAVKSQLTIEFEFGGGCHHPIDKIEYSGNLNSFRHHGYDADTFLK